MKLVETRPGRVRRAMLGLVLALAGAAGLVALFAISNSPTAAGAHLALQIGLAGAVLLSALAQTALIVGLWLLWTVRGRRGR